MDKMGMGRFLMLGSVLLQWLQVLFAFVSDFTMVSHVLAVLALLPVFVICLLAIFALTFITADKYVTSSWMT